METKNIEVEGVTRSYLQYTPGQPTWVLLIFHGNGGTAEGFAKKYGLEKIMPEGIIIYLQGIPGIGGGFDPKGLKNGWQRKAGEGADRDLKAIDVLTDKISTTYPGLKNKIYAMGHSNGGRFTYLLWNQRAYLFAGFIINAHQGVDLFESGGTAKPAMIITGKTDRVVNNANQLKTAELVKRINNTDQEEKITEELTCYSNKKSGLKLYHYLHKGGHDLPKTALKFVQLLVNEGTE